MPPGSVIFWADLLDCISGKKPILKRDIIFIYIRLELTVAGDGKKVEFDGVEKSVNVEKRFRMSKKGSECQKGCRMSKKGFYNVWKLGSYEDISNNLLGSG